MFYWVAKKGKFPADKWRFDKTDPHYCSVVVSKTNVILLIYCKLKTNFIAKSQLLYIGRPLRESVNKRKIQFSFSKVSASAYERVSDYGNVQIQSDWEVKRGFEKASGSRAVRLRECPFIAGSWLYSYSKSTLDRSSRHSRPLEMSTSFFKQRLVSRQA